MTSATIRADSQIPEFCAPQLSRRKDGINLQHRTYQGGGYLLGYPRYRNKIFDIQRSVYLRASSST